MLYTRGKCSPKSGDLARVFLPLRWPSFSTLSSSWLRPLAVCQNLTWATDANCQAVVDASDFDGGSTDPNSDPLTFSINPAGPYALGATNVRLSVSDGTSRATYTATITVSDQSYPAPTPLPTDWDEVIKATAKDAGSILKI